MSIDGNWRLTVDTPVGKQQVNVAISTAGGTISGTVTDDYGTLDAPIFDGTLRGDQLSFKTRVPRPFPMTLVFTGTAGADRLDGTVKLGIFGKRPAEAVRV